ncbi:lytic polysaccharide monooxygenase [Aplosporella prunicola CBS 121167]|uniref:Lytic polysaccharide monooxygenase n=1 Tax=Aplosporella prunicola CBS 121167 TaxID=1176127 RepID=A0A6A6B273_9PEZI|nr:lytic polysaccharide monooxygenase [Aplosporella prunicola CBS 121167]KAF2137324.1 lytic polysaccharide monooxygenase [Aplosporella prunicola CBS 121167]
MRTFATAGTAAALVASVSAHGHVASIVAGSKTYTGYDPSFSYQTPAPKVPGWSAQNLDNGFVEPSSFSSPDIICHKEGKPGQSYVEVAAGEEVKLQWSTWPDSHVGPIIDYLASCDGDCTTVDKTKLQFVKIDQDGYHSGSSPGEWATTDLISNDFTWSAKIPKDLKAGNYVLRHEIIALHSAGQENGAQAYPQCVNLKVTGSGSTAISGGESATEFYKADDAGIKFNVYTEDIKYTIPGPALWKSAAAKLRRHVRDFTGY